ncbi:hypothetical protein NW759_004420 [Fusarium solani]|nr:hypothetical protein NW759_004420 [Fusarium solani]
MTRLMLVRQGWPSRLRHGRKQGSQDGIHGDSSDLPALQSQVDFAPSAATGVPLQGPSFLSSKSEASCPGSSFQNLSPTGVSMNQSLCRFPIAPAPVATTTHHHKPTRQRPWALSFDDNPPLSRLQPPASPIIYITPLNPRQRLFIRRSFLLDSLFPSIFSSTRSIGCPRRLFCPHIAPSTDYPRSVPFLSAPIDRSSIRPGVHTRCT